MLIIVSNYPFLMENRNSSASLHHEGALNNTFKYQVYSAIVISIIQLITLYFLGRKLTAVQLGIFGVYQMIFRFAFAVFEPGMFASLIQKHEISQKLLHYLKRFQYIIFLIFVVVLLGLFYQQWIAFGVEAIVLVISILVSAAIAFGSLYHARLILVNKQFEIAVLFTIAHSIEFILLFSMLQFLPEIYCFTISLLVRFCVFYIGCYYLVRKTKIEYTVPSIELNEHRNYGLNYCLMQGLSYLQGIYDNILIALLFGPAFFGIYVLACELSYFVFSKINPLFNKSYFPVLTSKIKHKEESFTMIQSVFESFLYVVVPIYLFLFFQSGTILHWLYPDKANDLLMPFQYFLLIAFVKSLTNLVFTMYLAHGKTKEIFIWNLVIAITNYLFVFIFFIVKVDYERFMLFMLLYSILVLIILSVKLFSLLDLHGFSKITFMRLSIYIAFSFLSIFAFYYYGLNFIVSSLLYLICVLSLFYIVNKQKFLDLLSFKIV